MVEHTAVNRGVVGSSPTRGVFFMSQIHFELGLSLHNIWKIMSIKAFDIGQYSTYSTMMSL